MTGINKPRVRQILADGDADRFMVTVTLNGASVSGIAQLSNCERVTGRFANAWHKVCKRVIELRRDLEAMQR